MSKSIEKDWKLTAITRLPSGFWQNDVEVLFLESAKGWNWLYSLAANFREKTLSIQLQNDSFNIESLPS